MKKTNVQTWRTSSLAVTLITFTLLLTTYSSNAQFETWSWVRGEGKTNDTWAQEDANAVAVDSKGNVYVAGSFSHTLVLGNDTLVNIDNDWAIMLVKYNKSGDVVWARGFGDGHGNNDEATKIFIDDSDNIFIAGGFASDTLDFGNNIKLIGAAGSFNVYGVGSYDAYVARFDTTGVAQWAVSGTCNRYSYTKGLVVNENGIYFSGEYAGDTILIGGQVILNSSVNKIDDADLFLAKYNLDGSFAWAKTINSNYGIWAFDMADDKDGNMVIVGKYYGTSDVMDFGNNIMLVKDNDAYQELFIAKFDKDGKAIWAKGADAPMQTASDAAEDVVIDDCGNIYVTGYFNSSMIKFDTQVLTSPNYGDLHSNYMFILKLYSDGDVAWAKKVNRATEGHVGGISLDKTQRPIVYGGVHTYDSIPFQIGDSIYDAPSLYLLPFISTMNAHTGEFEWSEVARNINTDDFWFVVVEDVAVDNDGNLATAGIYAGYNVALETTQCNLGAGTITPHGNNDYFVGVIPLIGTYNDENEILSFSLNGLEDTVIIDTANHTIAVTVPLGTGVKSLTPAITLSNNAIICENHKDFSSPVIYTVYAEDGTIQQWTVAVSGWDNSIDENAIENNIIVYPNPSNGKFTIETSSLSGSVVERSRNAETTIKIYDITGKLIYEQAMDTNEKQKINLENYKEGMYYLQLVPENGEIITKKIIIN